MGEKNMVHGIPSINYPNQLCEACLLGKHARRSFPKEAMSRSTKPLQLVHTDVCGPINPPSFVLVEKESGYEIKALRSDRGGEFTSNEFNDFCQLHGIRRPLTVPYSSQQNGVAERKNQTILNMARCMLKAKSMPKEFWAEAVSYAVYLNNRSPTRNVKDQTPQEVWSGRNPSVKHLRIFGSIAYAHVPHQGRAKFDDRSVKHVFVSYDTSSKGYKLYNPSSEEPETVEPVQDTTPPSSPTNVASPSSQEGSNEQQQKTRSIQELYEDTEVTNFDFFMLRRAHVILPGPRSEADGGWNFYLLRKLYKGDIEEVQHARLQPREPTDGKWDKIVQVDEGEKVDPTFFKCLVGSLRYLTCTRPDILFAVGVVSRFMEDPTSTHLKVTRRILRYLKSTIDFGLFYSSSNDFNLVGCHAIWLRRLLKELNLPQMEATEICIDNKSTQALAKNPVCHDRSKHIDTRYHFIRERIAKKEVGLKYMKSHDQVADIFTKPLKFEDFQRLRSRIGMKKKNQN
uniref:Uncharacterized protein LOC104210538 n=1 Tax=Nicotiana sylvestris TaxID=4096 RepID=A0A1U7UU79_NICSY|nr:PREDICTED: uncharacterized protein LOC104210538 [Nicotiana sylvestris]